ncbi:Anaphase-promoting complex subunit 1 [Paramarasmius palmivorus]|uniref:Anaphase-promoting complex subunit 1 n=1 Tax=Paramarasmius palmivorus TaxID=297713 RepID=A0AAW0BLJ5_9AGAR
MDGLPLPFYDDSTSAIEEHLKWQHRQKSKEARPESNLLKSIRSLLHTTPPNTHTPVQSTCFFAGDDSGGNEDELTWDETTVVLSSGGIVKKKWSFGLEGQPVLWACMGWVEAGGTKATKASTKLTPPKSSSERPTFGPFFYAEQQNRITKRDERDSRVFAVFIFLRTLGKIYARNGAEYTFSIPFTIEKAWPISPHGLLLQRILEPSEKIEAELTGDAILPTIFCLTNPLAEPSPVGLASGIIGGFNNASPASLKDNDEYSTKPLKSLSPSEHIIWASHRGRGSPHEIVVTVDVEKRTLTVWRYVYIKPKDTPRPLSRSKPRPPPNLQPPPPVQTGSRRSSAAFPEPFEKSQQLAIPPLDFPNPDLPPLSALPGMPPELSSTTTMASIASGTANSGFGSMPSLPRSDPPPRKRRNSLTRNDLSVTMDRMALVNRGVDEALMSTNFGRMKTALWMEQLLVTELDASDIQIYRSISVSLFDHRWDGEHDRSLLAICLPYSQVVKIYTLSQGDDKRAKLLPLTEVPGLSVSALKATRNGFLDLLIQKPGDLMSIMTHGTYEIPISFIPRKRAQPAPAPADVTTKKLPALREHGQIRSIANTLQSTIFTTLKFEDGWVTRTVIDLMPRDPLTIEVMQQLALCLPSDLVFEMHHSFLRLWAAHSFSVADGIQFDCLSRALFQVFNLDSGVISSITDGPPEADSWHRLSNTFSHRRFAEDPVLRGLVKPTDPAQSLPPVHHLPIIKGTDKYRYLVGALYVLHTLLEQYRMFVHRYPDLIQLGKVVCRIAMYIRPEWADYWRRLCPEAMAGLPWPLPATAPVQNLDDGIPCWPPDVSAILFGRISTPEWPMQWTDASKQAERFRIKPSWAYGRLNPLEPLQRIHAVYEVLGDPNKKLLKRAEQAVRLMVDTKIDEKFISKLSIGIAAPLREAIRSMQLVPPSDFPPAAYKAIDREDVAASASAIPDKMSKDGYLSIKDYLSRRNRQTINEISSSAKVASSGESEMITTGVELDLEEFTSIRFGQDRRLDEVARILSSSKIPSLKAIERPDQHEHDQAKEQQHQAIRVAERTLALPYGRAMFTYGSIHNISREAFLIPKLEYTIRLLPHNVTVIPEPGKIPPDSYSWGEFHNGVAAALRISPSCTSIDSSWIAFNKPSELTPEHAGFLFGLGLTGHLREMMTWHTFSYLTPKHDLTSIGVLLGLAAANMGNENAHVTKLLAVHTPALLPTPDVDLNVSLLAQAAGIAGVGLLYMGTKNRRMAEVCLNQISRKDLVQPDLSNEYREAYTYSAALAFGMIMLGKGTTIPADSALLARLNILIQGDFHLMPTDQRAAFDVNLTSPAASIALGLMYLKTERQDIADILATPDTVLSLNRIQPSFLLIRTLSRALIMWDKIAPTQEWISAQVPARIRKGIENRSKYNNTISDVWELAYYNIIAGCCFAIGLKYAGTARQEAYKILIRYYDLFTRMIFSNSPAFEWRIKRSAVRDGLNLISISLSMVMAGTGEITCLRRLRYAYGMYTSTMYHPAFKYGIHVATHQSLGLLFLGGGRFTLGTSDAAIACMVAAFFPRSHVVSSDNKSYLQALRHLWVLAVEPRCLIARDIETKEIVYLPLKIAVREGQEIGTTQLISPTLIPNLDRLVGIRVDTPRYWPFHLYTEGIPRHKECLLRSQTLYVKRRTAFLSYTEDPRGSRSLFVRSRSSAGDAATLDHPQLIDTKTHPAGDLWEFITSCSNNPLFLAFADHFCSGVREGATDREKLFFTYCHAALFDSILQGKPQTLQMHLTLFRYRHMTTQSRYFHLNLMDLRFSADFYSKIFDRRFGGRVDNNPRTPLLRDSTVSGTLYVLDQRLDAIRTNPDFKRVLQNYSLGTLGTLALDEETNRNLAWYLIRNSVPASTLLTILKSLAQDAHNQCLGVPPPEGTDDVAALDLGIKEVLHATGTKMTIALGTGWSARSIDEIVETWKES